MEKLVKSSNPVPESPDTYSGMKGTELNKVDKAAKIKGKSPKEYLSEEYAISDLSKEWLRADTGLIKQQGHKALKIAKSRMRGSWYRYEQIEGAKKGTMRMVRVERGTPGSFLV